MSTSHQLQCLGFAINHDDKLAALRSQKVKVRGQNILPHWHSVNHVFSD